MASYTGPRCRLCRSSGVKLFLKGEKCELPKCPVVRRQVLPGQHSRVRIKRSDYSLHLREKQKLKRIYLAPEAQLRKYFEKSRRSLGKTGEVLLSLLERRLDNVLVRVGLAVSRSQARQLIRHGYVKVNGQATDIPSYTVGVDDRVECGKIESLRPVTVPSWLSLDVTSRTVLVTALPKREDVVEDIDEQLVVEFYSR